MALAAEGPKVNTSLKFKVTAQQERKPGSLFPFF
jgi:hypothetical protein